MAIAISDLVYDLNKGYLAYAAVLNALDATLGRVGAPGEPPRIQLMGNAAYITRAIKDAFSSTHSSLAFVEA
jgi:hypothetical protein